MGKRNDPRSGLLELVVLQDVYMGNMCNTPCSPSDLVYSRSHAELAGRKPRPVNEGVSFREEMNTRDYYNWE